MGKCPKCQQKLSVLNWRQNCPHCGTNLMFYGFEERFYADAKAAEMSLANVRVKLAKVKVGLIGGKLQIVRFVFVLLPVLALLVPQCSASISLPVYSKELSFGAIGLYQSFSDGAFALFGEIVGAKLIGSAAAAAQGVCFALLGAAGAAVLIVLCQLLSFISFKKMAAILCALSVVGIAASIYGVVSSASLVSAADGVGSFLTVSSGVGGYVSAASFLAVFAVNLIVAIKGFEIEYKPGDLYRVEMRKKLRKKKITFDEIPYPIYETEEEKLAREAAIAETARQTAAALEVSTND